MVLGPEHPSVATTMNNLASLYEARGDSERALALYKESLQFARRVLGDSHPDVARILNNLAGCLKQLGRYDDSVGYYRQALEIMERMLGLKNEQTRTLRANLSAAEKSARDAAEQGPAPDARTSRQ